MRSRLPYEGSALSYDFTGQIAGNTMSGSVNLGIGEYTRDYGKAQWTAKKSVSA